MKKITLRTAASTANKRRFPVSLPGTFLLILLTLAGLLGTDLYRSYDREFATQRQNAANLGDVIERHVRASIDKIDVVLLETVHDVSPLVLRLNQSGNTKPLELLNTNRDLLRREAFMPEAQAKSLRIINANGQVIYNAGETAEIPNVNVFDRSYFQKQKNNPNAGLVMSEPILSRFTGKWLFTLSRRITDSQGNFVGLVQTALRADQFEAGFAAIDVGNNGNVSLFSLAANDVRLMARKPAMPDKLGNAFNIPEIATAFQEHTLKGSYRATSRVDGVDRLFVFRQFEGLPLVVNIGVSYPSLLENWWNKAALYAFSLLILVLELIWLLNSQRRAAARQQALLEHKVQERTQALSETNEQLAEAMQQAQAANITKTQFLSTVSHELRTPLNGILGMTQVLKMDNVSDEERKEYASVIHNSGHALLELVNGILDFSKIEAGKTELNLYLADPVEIVEETVALYQQLAHQKSLTLENHIDLAVPRALQLDTIRLKQMLGNLVTNAIKFTDHGSIRVDLTHHETADGKPVLRFAVTDTGIGIPADKLALLFQPFSQVDASVTRAHEGTGLGLSIVRKLAELMGGQAGVTSTEGQGSCFWFEIPTH